MELIVSIQNYSKTLSQELATAFYNIGVKTIRTDKPYKFKGEVIGLKKNTREFYITTRAQDIRAVAKWADIIAIDSRAGNVLIPGLYKEARREKRKICADIQNETDLLNIKEICLCNQIEPPEYIATTFSFMGKGYPDINLIKAIKKHFPGSAVIAEGKYYSYFLEAKEKRADYICIGAGLTNFIETAEKIIRGINGK
jgi:putative N-acetylmannosamine-6-phosphate epimerase